jgi:hypothetical protein
VQLFALFGGCGGGFLGGGGDGLGRMLEMDRRRVNESCAFDLQGRYDGENIT